MQTYDKAWLDAATPDIAKGVRGAIATLIPFYLAVRLGRHEFAWMAVGGWLGTLVDPGGLRSTRAKTLSTFAVVGSIALGCSEQLGDNTWLAALALFVVAFVASVLRSLGAVWASAGTMVTIVVAIGSARGAGNSLRDAVFFAAGASFATLLSSVIWPIWTHLPLRRAEANVFEGLARYATEIDQSARAHLAEGDVRWTEVARRHHRAIRNAVEEASRLALGGRAARAGETRIGSNLRVLLGLAEAQFPLLVTLKEAIELAPHHEQDEALSRRLHAFSRRSLETATILRTPNLRAQEARLSLPPPGAGPKHDSSVGALLEHLDDASRTAQTIASSLGSRADQVVEPRSRHWPTLAELRAWWRPDFATVRDALSPHSTFFQHGVRLACTVSLSSLIAHRVTLYPHWVTVTTLAVLQPYSGATARRAAQRVIGTVFGCIVAAAINLTLQSPVLLAIAMFPLSVAAVATQRRNYRLFTFFLTPVFVLVAERFQGDFWTAGVRAGDAALGGGIAFVAAVLVFPARERRRLAELLARMLDALAAYSVVVLEAALERHSQAAENRVLAARRSAGIALSEAEDSLERLLAEPRRDMQAAEYALQVVTYGRRAAGALTAIDTHAAHDLTPHTALRADLVHGIERYVVSTLHRAAALARGATPEPEAKVPELPSDLEPALASTLARLLRGAALVAAISLDRPEAAAEVRRVVSEA